MSRTAGTTDGTIASLTWQASRQSASRCSRRCRRTTRSHPMARTGSSRARTSAARPRQSRTTCPRISRGSVICTWRPCSCCSSWCSSSSPGPTLQGGAAATSARESSCMVEDAVPGQAACPQDPCVVEGAVRSQAAAGPEQGLRSLRRRHRAVRVASALHGNPAVGGEDCALAAVRRVPYILVLRARLVCQGRGAEAPTAGWRHSRRTCWRLGACDHRPVLITWCHAYRGPGQAWCWCAPTAWPGTPLGATCLVCRAGRQQRRRPARPRHGGSGPGPGVWQGDGGPEVIQAGRENRLRFSRTSIA